MVLLCTYPEANEGEKKLLLKGLVKIENENLSRFIPSDYSPENNSNHNKELVAALRRTGAFDTVFIINGAVYVSEKKPFQPTIAGADAGLTILGQTQLWAAVFPGLEIRHICGRPQALSVALSFPFIYAATAHWREYGFPHRKTTVGLQLNVRSVPYTNSAYYQRSGGGTAYCDYFFTRNLSTRVSGSIDVAKTWKIDIDIWDNDRMALVEMDPARIMDLSSPFFPSTEEAVSYALSLNYDLRNNALYPSSGTHTYIEGRRYHINQPSRDYDFDFNQLSGTFKAYVSPKPGQITAFMLKGIVRDTFDSERLSHRLIFHDETAYFVGFSGIGGTNIITGNIEYRYRLFNVDMAEIATTLALAPELVRRAKRLSYHGDAFAFVNNGAYFGRVLPNLERGVSRYKPFTSLTLDDIYTSAGIGGRLIYPGLGQVVTAAIVWSYNSELPKDYLTRLYAAASLSF